MALDEGVDGAILVGDRGARNAQVACQPQRVSAAAAIAVLLRTAFCLHIGKEVVP